MRQLADSLRASLTPTGTAALIPGLEDSFAAVHIGKQFVTRGAAYVLQRAVLEATGGRPKQSVGCLALDDRPASSLVEHVESERN